jgi:hypothetical protein
MPENLGPEINGQILNNCRSKILETFLMTQPRGWCEIAQDSLELMNKDISVFY